MLPPIVSFPAPGISLYIFILEKESYCSIEKREKKKMIGHHTCCKRK